MKYQPFLSARFVTGVLLAVTTVNGACESNWTQNGSLCYQIFRDTVTYESAVQLCGNLGAQVVIIKDQQQNDYIKTFIFEDTWLGLKKQTSEIQQWQWLDGSSLDYQNWGYGEPQSGETCARIRPNDGRWLGIGCGRSFAYVCQKNIDEGTCIVCLGIKIGGIGLAGILFLVIVIVIICAVKNRKRRVHQSNSRSRENTSPSRDPRLGDKRPPPIAPQLDDDYRPPPTAPPLDDGIHLGSLGYQERVPPPVASVDSASTARSANDCVICMEAEKNTVIMPCRHMCTCRDCSEQLRARRACCPLCRGPISDITNVYI